MSTNTPKKDPLSSLFGPGSPAPDPTAPNDTPEPGNVRAPKPVSRPMPPPVLAVPTPAAADPRQLAKALAKAAVAKAGPANVAPTPATAAKPAPAAQTKPTVRGIASAPLPAKKLSAVEALELARKQEAERSAAAAAPPPKPAAPAAPAAAPVLPSPPAFAAPVTPVPTVITEEKLGDAVQAVLGEALPGAQVYIANAMFAEDRKALAALWRSHRARFLATHQIEYAVGASAVLSALNALPHGQLAVAHGVTDKGEFLLWVDLRTRALVTAFANPRQLVAGW